MNGNFGHRLFLCGVVADRMLPRALSRWKHCFSLPTSFPLYRPYLTHLASEIPYRICFFGSDDISCACLSVLLEADPRLISLPDLQVVTMTDSKQGRGLQKQPNLLKQLALDRGLMLHEVNRETRFQQWKPSVGAFDLAVVVSFGLFMPLSVISRFPLGAINVHPSLLPAFRGPAPIQAAYLSGSSTTGVSIIEVHPKIMDGGNILQQQKLDVSGATQLGDVRQGVKRLSGPLLLDVITNLGIYRENSVVQNESAATYAPLTKPSVFWRHQWPQLPPSIEGGAGLPKVGIGQGAPLSHVSVIPFKQWQRAIGIYPLRLQLWSRTLTGTGLKRGPIVRILQSSCISAEQPNLRDDLPDQHNHNFPVPTHDSHGLCYAHLVWSPERRLLSLEIPQRGALHIDTLQVAGKKPTSATSFASGYLQWGHASLLVSLVY